MIEGYGLTLAHILYYRKDYPSLLNSFTWQTYDVSPSYPVLQNFLRYWKENIESPIHSVTVSHERMLTPQEFRRVDNTFQLH